MKSPSMPWRNMFFMMKTICNDVLGASYSRERGSAISDCIVANIMVFKIKLLDMCSFPENTSRDRIELTDDGVVSFLTSASVAHSIMIDANTLYVFLLTRLEILLLG